MKLSIERVIEHSKGSYQLKNKNDVFNTYTLILMGGMELVNANLQLKKISDNETGITLTSGERIRNSGHEIQVNKILDSFFNLVAKGLSGEAITAEMVTKGKAGCVLALIMYIAIGSLSVWGITALLNT